MWSQQSHLRDDADSLSRRRADRLLHVSQVQAERHRIFLDSDSVSRYSSKLLLVIVAVNTSSESLGFFWFLFIPVSEPFDT